MGGVSSPHLGVNLLPHLRFAMLALSSFAASAALVGQQAPAQLRSGAFRSPSALMSGTTSDDMGMPCVGDCATESFPNLPSSVHPGVLTGQALVDLLEDAKSKGYAIPAVNCVTSSSVNACLEAARQNDAPIIIQFSSGGAQFYAGKGLDNTDYKATIAGAISGAYHVRAMAEQYGVPVILHTDHCAKNLLPWLDGMLDASEKYFATHGEPVREPERAIARALAAQMVRGRRRQPIRKGRGAAEDGG